MRVARSAVSVSITIGVALCIGGAFRLHAQSSPQAQSQPSQQTPAPPKSQMTPPEVHSMPAGTADAKAAPKLAEEQFKNIQVLKGIPADQLIPAMQFIAASLGVECEYCHVQHAFEKDDKKTKQTARKMISMMLAINKDHFDGHRDVTCNTCHRGAPDPVAIPAVAARDEPVVPHEQEEAEGTGERDREEHKGRPPDAAELLNDYLTAVGGADALHKISSRVEKGKLVSGFPGMKQPFPIDLYAKAPDKRVSIMHTPGGDSITAFNARQGWLALGGRTHMMTAAENDAARIDADLYFAANLKSLYPRFVTQPGEKIDGHDTWLVIGRSEPGAANPKPPLRLYFDKNTGLLLRLVRYTETPLGRNPTQIDYADYRATDGVKIPYRWTLARPGGRFTIQIDSVQQNVPIDEAKFTPPPSEPPVQSRP
jgi:photosynthetic reaction center cytochrome c subunit